MQHRRAATIVCSLLLGTALAFLVFNAHAGCQSQMRILADDLAGVELTSAQRQLIADKVLMARRHCWVHHEKEAMRLINAARKMAGLKEASDEFDWETVPLESLEKPPPH